MKLNDRANAKDYVILNPNDILDVDPKTLPKDMQKVLRMDSYEMFKNNRNKLKILEAREKRLDDERKQLDERDKQFQIERRNEYERLRQLEDELTKANKNQKREIEDQHTDARASLQRFQNQNQELENQRQELQNQRQELEQRIANQEQDEARRRYEAIRDQADRITKRIDDLRNELNNADENHKESHKRKIREEMAELGRLEGWAEEAEGKIPLKKRIKEIFKKHGFTVVAVLTAVSAVIGAIVANLKHGLATLGKGMGNGLKATSKKLGQILPGTIGTIASFIFQNCG